MSEEDNIITKIYIGLIDSVVPSWMINTKKEIKKIKKELKQNERKTPY